MEAHLFCKSKVNLNFLTDVFFASRNIYIYNVLYIMYYIYIIYSIYNISRHGFRVSSSGSLGGVDCEGIDGRCLGRSVPPKSRKRSKNPHRWNSGSLQTDRIQTHIYLKLFLTHVWEQSSNFNCFCRVYVLTCCFSFYITRTLSRFLSTCPFLATPLWNGTVVQPNISVLHIALEVEVSSYSRHFWVICVSTRRLSV